MARQVENPDIAFRLARAIVSDIALYNQDKVKDGIQRDSIFDLLEDELQEGLDHFHSRVAETVKNRDELYDRAVVDVLIKQQAGKFDSPIW